MVAKELPIFLEALPDFLGAVKFTSVWQGVFRLHDFSGRKKFKEFEKVTLKYFRNNKKINSAADFGGKPVTS
jgi:transcriptional regulator of nitric oxide reductase